MAPAPNASSSEEKKASFSPQDLRGGVSLQAGDEMMVLVLGKQGRPRELIVRPKKERPGSGTGESDAGDAAGGPDAGPDSGNNAVEVQDSGAADEAAPKPDKSAGNGVTGIAIHIDAADAAAFEHTYRLFSTDDEGGSYQQTRTLKSDHKPKQGHVELHFDGLGEELAYSLEVNFGDHTTSIFDNVPYSELGHGS